MADLLVLLKKNAAKRVELLEERDRLILEAKAAGVPVSHIADAVEMSRVQVHRIIADAK